MPLSSVPRAQIALIEDESLLGKSIQRYLSEYHHCQWFQSTEAALEVLERDSVDVIVSDIKLPGKSGLDLMRWVTQNQPQTPVILITAHSSIPAAVQAVREGASDYLSKPLDLSSLELSIARVLRNTRLEQEVQYHRKQASQKPFLRSGLTNPAYLEIGNRIQRLLDVERRSGEVPSILITGETGTGKGVLARSIHEQSIRNSEPFIEINSTAIPDTMVESELFGHEKGTFTGAASQRAGLFEVANGGTLFLDEIGHIPLAMQAKLLKVIEDKRVRRIGGKREIELDIRLIVATNLDLAQAVRNGEFREDLYHRLALIEFSLPALREVPNEIPVLAETFLRDAVQKYAIPHNCKDLQISPANKEVLLQHSWPGNIRELCNEVERAVLFHGLDNLHFSHLHHLHCHLNPQTARKNAPNAENPSLFQLPEDGVALLEVEVRLLAQALRQASGDQQLAAQMLRITERELKFRLNRHQCNWEETPDWHHPLPETGISLEEVEQGLIRQALERTGGKVAKAARLLNLSRDQLRYRVEKH